MQDNHKGYLIISEKKEIIKEKQPENEKNEELKTEQKETFYEFTPLLLSSHEGKKYREFSCFNDCLDIFFQNQVQKKDEKYDKEQMIWKKYNNIK